MHTLAEHPVDADTTRTAFAFLNRASETFAVKGAILFGSRARVNSARTVTSISRWFCRVHAASS